MYHCYPPKELNIPGQSFNVGLYIQFNTDMAVACIKSDRGFKDKTNHANELTRPQIVAGHAKTHTNRLKTK
jgi:hypothetical protein